MDSLPNKPWLRPKEIAEAWGINPRTVCKWFQEGKIRGRKLGYKIVQIERQSLIEFLENRPER